MPKKSTKFADDESGNAMPAKAKLARSSASPKSKKSVSGGSDAVMKARIGLARPLTPPETSSAGSNLVVDSGQALAHALEAPQTASGGSVEDLPSVQSLARSLAAPDIDPICISLQEDQVQRKFTIQMEAGIVQRISALVVRGLGASPQSEEGERAAAWRRAERVVRRGLAGDEQEPDDAEIAAAVAESLRMSADAIAPVRKLREIVEARMREKAAKLPGFSLTERTPGFKAIGLAVIVGEAGNLSNYATVRKLWRRLGLGMAPGHEAHAYSTWKMKGGLTSEDWTAAGYSPKRLGQIYGVVTVPLAMNKGKNKYGEIYAKRREHTAITHPTGTLKECKADPVRWTPGHSHADALRVMTKELISDLWSEWRGSDVEVDPACLLAPSTHFAEAAE